MLFRSARIYGYDNIPVVEKISIPMKSTVDESEYNDKLRGILTSLGCYEIISNSLQKKELAVITGNPVKVLNPISSDLEVLRTSLLQGCLNTIVNNLNVGEKSLKLFEIGHVFKQINENINDFSDFTEKEHLMVALTGASINEVWYDKNRQYDYFDLKGIVEELFSKLGFNNISFAKPEHHYQHMKNQFEIVVNNKIVGYLGIVSANILKKFDISQAVYYAEIELDILKSLKVNIRKFKELQKYPKVIKDLAFIVDKNITYAELEEFIYKNSKNILKFVKPFDIFESDEFGKNNRSIAIRLEFYDENMTLTEEVVEKEFVSIIEKVRNKFNAQLRGEVK